MHHAPGYISADALDPDIVHQLMYGPQATNESQHQQYIDAKHEARSEGLQPGTDEYEGFIEGYMDCPIEEPTVTGTYQGVKYASSWLGGALNFWILESPHTTDKGRRCSPCLQPASTVILDTLDGDTPGFDVPSDWRNAY